MNKSQIRFAMAAHAAWLVMKNGEKRRTIAVRVCVYCDVWGGVEE